MYDRILKDITLKYEEKRRKAKKLQDIRKKEVYKKIPAVEKIEKEMFLTGLEISKSIIKNPENAEKEATKAKEKLNRLQMEKAYLLTECNIPLDYMDLKYDCKKCKDKGYTDDGKKCICLKQDLVSEAYKMSNLEHMLKTQNFETFDINIFPDEKFQDEPLTIRENMLEILNISKLFIKNFDKKDGQNLLFYGTTGLGKTFLSNCIAKELLDMNKIVVYQTAFTILEILENKRFNRTKDKLSQFQYDLIINSDLLIVDDLGTEMSNTFTSTEIFNIINTRIIRQKKTIISSNLSPKEISDTYTDRVFSRVLENFIPLKFYGQDLRWE